MINSPLRAVGPRGLLRLSTTLSQLFPDEVDFNHNIFKDLTHLDVLDRDDGRSEFIQRLEQGNNLACLGKLGCLCFSGVPDLRPSSSNSALVAKCLEECSSLGLMLFIDYNDDLMHILSSQLSTIRRRVSEDGMAEVPEDRMVRVDEPKDWNENCAFEALVWNNIWTIGESIAENRRQKDVTFLANPRGE